MRFRASPTSQKKGLRYLLIQLDVHSERLHPLILNHKSYFSVPSVLEYLGRQTPQLVANAAAAAVALMDKVNIRNTSQGCDISMQRIFTWCTQ